MKKIISLLICIAFTFTLFSCSELPTETTTEDISTEKASSENTDNVLGKGETVIYVDVITPDKTERFTVYTDSKVLGTAIQECGLAPAVPANQAQFPAGIQMDIQVFTKYPLHRKIKRKQRSHAPLARLRTDGCLLGFAMPPPHSKGA